MTYTVTGYIIGKEDVREYDRIFTLYTKECGKMTVLAQGVRKITSKLCGNLESLSHVSCQLAKGRSLDRITGVEMLDRFLPIKEQLRKCSTAFYFFEVFNHLVKNDQQDEELYELVCDFLNSLRDIQVLKIGPIGNTALVRLSMLLGYEGRSKKIIQSLQRSRSIMSFVKSRTKQEYGELLRCAQAFVRDQCERQMNSKAYFDFYALQQSKDGE